MKDSSEMQESPVGAQHAVPVAGCANGADTPKSRAGEPAGTSGVADKPGVLGEELIFDAGKLHAQLANLLQIYLKRAGDADAVETCSAKDAVNCAKNITGMMSDLQGGKPASVSKNTEWPRITPRVRTPIQASDHKVCRLDSRHHPEGSSPTTSYLLHPTGSTSLLDDALAAVLSTDEESYLDEPYQRLLSRMERLCAEVRARLEEAKSRTVGRGLRAPPNPNSSGTGDSSGGTGVPPVIAPKKSRAGEPAGTCGVADKPGVLGGNTDSSRYSLHATSYAPPAKNQHLSATPQVQAEQTTNNRAAPRAPT